MNRRKPSNTIFITSLVSALALVVALAPFSEAGKRSERQVKWRSVRHHDTTTKSPWLGVQIQTVDEDLAERYDLETKSGVYVDDVVDGSPADDAGLRTGDIILQLNGADLQSADELIDLVADGQPGDEITLSINRNGRTLTKVVSLGERERLDGRIFSALRLGSDLGYSFSESLTQTYIGVSLETITGQLLAYFGADKGSGALIKEVAEDTPAEKAGLEAGDVIVKVAGEKIESLRDVQDAVEETDEGGTIELTVLRNKREKSFTVTVEERETSFFEDPLFDQSFGSNSGRLLQLQSLPRLPRLRGLSRGSFAPRSLYFDLDDNQGEMQRLRRDMRKLRRELDRLRVDLDGK